jgi:septum formation protein
MKLILASASPRRREMLRHLGIDPVVVTSQVCEDIDVASPEDAVRSLAQRKALAVRDALSKPSKSGKVFLDAEDVVLAADTIVVSPSGELMGKPFDREDAARMIADLQGREHRVISGICICRGEQVEVACETTTVTFDAMSEDTIARFVSCGESDDKAGAYGIQGLAALFIEGIRGDYFNVVGLPLRCLEQLLQQKFSLSLLDFRS